MGEETILKNGSPALSRYDDCTHSYLTPLRDAGPTGRKIFIKTVKDLICLLSNLPPGSTWTRLHSSPDWGGNDNKFEGKGHKMEEVDSSVRGEVGVSAQALTH